MRGYSPTFNNESKAEIASKKQSFIELGVISLVHKSDCKCESCLKAKNT